MSARTSVLSLSIILGALAARAAQPGPATPQAIDTSRGDAMIAAYFKEETARLSQRCLSDIKTLDDWTARRNEYRRQLREMLGLHPWPERTPLEPVVTGKIEHEL